MSAYLCDNEHMIQLAAYLCGGNNDKLRWIAHQTGGPESPQPDKLATCVANILMEENCRSLSARYGDDDPVEILSVSLQDIMKMRGADPAKMAKAVRCYSYQACESHDWEETKAHMLCNMINDAILERLPGYDDANWGAPLSRAA